MDQEKSYQDLLQTIAANIKTRRLSRGWTQEQMAEKGFNYRFYQKLESGTYSPNLQTLHRLAMKFECKLSDFLGAVDEKGIVRLRVENMKRAKPHRVNHKKVATRHRSYRPKK